MLIAALLLGSVGLTTPPQTPPQTPAEATSKIRTLGRTEWWLKSPDEMRRVWGNVDLRGGYDCSPDGARDRKCFFWTERQSCGNDEFMFGAVEGQVVLREFGVLACTPDRRSAEALMRKWKEAFGIPRKAVATRPPADLWSVRSAYEWRASPGIVKAIIDASHYTDQGWQIQLYVKVVPD